MIRSRAAASRAPAAPLRGRFAPPDPAARSQEPAAIRAREHSEARLKTVNGPSQNHLRYRGDAGKRTASGPKERSAEPLALPIRARFVPLRGHPDCSSGWCMPCIPGGRFSAVLLSRAAGWSCSFLRRGRLKDRPAPCHRGCRGRRRPSARRLPPVEDWRGAVASDAARGSGRARAAASCRKRGSRCPVSGTGSG
jgi:hypothetical protein